MGLMYKIASTKKPGQGKDGETLYFPVLTNTSQVDLRALAKQLSETSTASPADVYLIINGLIDLIPKLLADGKTVKLDGLGTFRLHAKVTTVATEAQVNVRNITSVRATFRPDNGIKKALKNVTITKKS